MSGKKEKVEKRKEKKPEGGVTTQEMREKWKQREGKMERRNREQDEREMKDR